MYSLLSLKPKSTGKNFLFKIIFVSHRLSKFLPDKSTLRNELAGNITNEGHQKK